MGALDDLVQRATAPLRGDRELQRDVAHELKTHLEEAAVAAAQRAFGDADEVGRDLFRANRRRMRLRALVRWAARVTLVPALALLLLLFAARSLGALAAAVDTWGNAPEQQGWMRYPLLRNERVRARLRTYAGRLGPRPDLSERQRALFGASQPGEFGVVGPLERAAASLAVDPDCPVLHGHYTSIVLETCMGERASPEELFLALDRGEQIEPENAFYNYMRAAWLMSEAVEADQDAERTYVIGPGTDVMAHATRLTVKDRSKLDRAVAEVRRGNAKAFHSNRQMDFARAQVALLRPARTLAQELHAMEVAGAVLLPDLMMHRFMARVLVGYAHVLAEEGRMDDALDVIETAVVVPLLTGKCADTIIGALVADACLRVAHGEGAHVCDEMGMPERAAELRRRLAGAIGAMPERREVSSDARARAALSGQIHLSPYGTAPDILRHLRDAERTVFERLALAGLLTVALVLFLPAAGTMLLIRLLAQRKGSPRPVLLFIGRRRLARVAGVSVGVPLAAYVLWSRVVSPWRDGSVAGAPVLFVIEMLVLGAATFLVAAALSHRAIRRRCREADLPVPRDPLMTWLWPPILAMAAVVLLVAAWSVTHLFAGRFAPFAAVVVPTAAVLGVWALLRRRAEDVGYAMTMMRSFIPVLACVLLLFAGVAHGLLSAAEAHHVRAIHRMGDLFVHEMKPFEEYRRYLAEELERLRVSEVIPSGAKRSRGISPPLEQRDASTEPALSEAEGLGMTEGRETHDQGETP